MPALIGLRGEPERHRRHVAVEAGAAHERHEQQVGEQVLEAEGDGDQELERARGYRVVEQRLGHRQVPDPVVHLRPAVEPAVVLVVVADRVDLRLGVPQLVHALAQRGEPRRGALKVAGEEREVPVRRVLQRGDALQEDLDRVEVAGVGQRQVTLGLREAVQDGVQPFVLLRLVLVIGVDGEPERVGPAVPVVDGDALVPGIRVQRLAFDVGGLPVEVPGQQRVPLLERQFPGPGLGLRHGQCSQLTTIWSSSHSEKLPA